MRLTRLTEDYRIDRWIVARAIADHGSDLLFSGIDSVLHYAALALGECRQ